MNEIIETINHTSALRTIFYGIVFLISLQVICNLIIDMINSIIRIFKK